MWLQENVKRYAGRDDESGIPGFADPGGSSSSAESTKIRNFLTREHGALVTFEAICAVQVCINVCRCCVMTWTMLRRFHAGQFYENFVGDVAGKFADVAVEFATDVGSDFAANFAISRMVILSATCFFWSLITAKHLKRHTKSLKTPLKSSENATYGLRTCLVFWRLPFCRQSDFVLFLTLLGPAD